MQTWSAKLAEPSKSCARQKKLCRPLVFYTSLMSLTNFHPKKEDKRRIATTSQQPTFHSTHSTYPFLTTPRCPRYLEGGMCTALTARCTPVTVAVFLWANGRSKGTRPEGKIPTMPPTHHAKPQIESTKSIYISNTHGLAVEIFHNTVELQAGSSLTAKSFASSPSKRDSKADDLRKLKRDLQVTGSTNTTRIYLSVNFHPFRGPFGTPFFGATVNMPRSSEMILTLVLRTNQIRLRDQASGTAEAWPVNAVQLPRKMWFRKVFTTKPQKISSRKTPISVTQTGLCTSCFLRRRLAHLTKLRRSCRTSRPLTASDGHPNLAHHWGMYIIYINPWDKSWVKVPNNWLARLQPSTVEPLPNQASSNQVDFQGTVLLIPTTWMNK